MISVALNPDIEQRLAELARRRGLSEGDFARELIEACIEDLDDIQMATGRLETRQPALTAEQARKALGLDDRGSPRCVAAGRRRAGGGPRLHARAAPRP